MHFFFHLKTIYFRFFEGIAVFFSFYWKEPRFILIDTLLFLSYFFKNPYRVSKEFLTKEENRLNLGRENSSLKTEAVEWICSYGETPLTTLAHIAKECGLTSKQYLYELGSGAGRGCFWLSTFVRCHTVGVDLLPEFIHKALRVKSLARLGNVDFLHANFLSVDLRKATVIYLYGTCLDDRTIIELMKNFASLLPGTRVISVSYPLTEYSSDFVLVKEFKGRFPWGKSSIFLNEKIYR